MTLAEKLWELAAWAEIDKQYGLANEIQTIAKECEGKVTIKASVEPELKPGAIPTGHFVANLEYTYCAGIGDTKEEAIADLQEMIDQIGNQS